MPKLFLSLSLSLSLIACGGGDIEENETPTSWRETNPRPITFLECSYSPDSPCTIVWPPKDCTDNCATLPGHLPSPF